jgi:hypothetical protein
VKPAIIFAPAHDSPGKRDATGAFQPEAHSFMTFLGGAKVIHVDNHQDEAARAEKVIGELVRDHPAPWRTVAFFCHGTARSIQLGFDRRNVDDLARAIAISSERDVRVLLYCCSTASSIGTLVGGKSVGGDDGFADMLRDALCEQGATHCRIVAHETVGHTTRNPYVRFFDGAGSPIGGVGGVQVVRPRSKPWTAWREALLGKYLGGRFRFQFPFLEIGEIHSSLLTGTIPGSVNA